MGFKEHMTAEENDAWYVAVTEGARSQVLACVANRLAGELERLQARLPKTADGVPVVQGMCVWYAGGREPRPNTVEVVRFAPSSEPFFSFERCYSTREAAEAAGGEA